MKYYKTIKDEINKGVDGDVPFLPILDPKLEQYVAIPKATSVLLGGQSGTGKTAVADTVFVLDPFDYFMENNLEINVKWIYRSMERPTKYKLGKWLCYKVFKDHGILVDVPTLYGWPNAKFKLTDELKDLFDSYNDYFEELESHMLLIDGATHPTDIYVTAKNFMKARGKIEDVDEHNKVYIPNNPKEIVVQLCDHVGKIKSEVDSKTNHRLSEKQTLDLHSSYSKNVLRDFYHMVTVDIMQLNRAIEDNMRQLKTTLDIKGADFKGSGNLYEDSDVVFGLLNPYKHKEFDFGGYDINGFVTNKNYCRYRAVKLLKNSYGPDDLMFDYNFIGESGIMRPMQGPDSFTQELYKKYAMAHHHKTAESIKMFNLQNTDYLQYYETYQN